VGFGQSIRHISWLYQSRCPRSAKLRGYLQRTRLHGIRDFQFRTQDGVSCRAWLSQAKLSTSPRCTFPPVAMHRQSSIRPHYNGLRLIDAVDSFPSKWLAVLDRETGRRASVSFRGQRFLPTSGSHGCTRVVNLSHLGKILRGNRPRQPSRWSVVRASRTLNAEQKASVVVTTM
jgi:hypothetical protein